MYMFKSIPLVCIKKYHIILLFLKIKTIKQMGHITIDDKSLKSKACTGKNKVLTTF